MPEANRSTRPKRPPRVRRKWATKHGDDPRLVDHHSEEMAYAHVDRMREAYRALKPSTHVITVMVAPWGVPGGWEVHERVDLRE